MPLQATSGAASYDAFGGGAAAVPAYIEDVFSTWLYTGNGSTQTITNGIDLSTKGGLVWTKPRDVANAHFLFDTNRGALKRIASNAQAAEAEVANSLTSFNTDGFTIGSSTFVNQSGKLFVSWSFRKQPKFFDVVTYTGTGVGRTISHNLGAVPGCIMIKDIDNFSGDWMVYHRSIGSGSYVSLNTTSAQTSNAAVWNSTDPTATVFSIGTNFLVNSSGYRYVAYLFAHDAGGFGLTGTDNVISCGSFTTDASANASVTLGYEPQFVLYKRSSGASNWFMLDNMRGWNQTGFNDLKANLSDAENAVSGNFAFPTATGFDFTNSGSLSASSTYIYIAIRRPMKVPTSGTSVFAPVAQAGSGTVTTNFSVDLTFSKNRSGFDGISVMDRLRGGSKTRYVELQTNATGAESSGTGLGFGFDNNIGYVDNGWWGSGQNIIYWNFRRAPSFFDEVCWTGDDTVSYKNHNLTVVPELIIQKKRSSSEAWYTWQPSSTNVGQLNSTAAFFSNGSSPSTSTQFTPITDSFGATYVAYLFATCAGVSKVGSYTGTGTTKQVDCGFTGGARFVLIKRTNSTGDWYVWDSARGIVAGNDPYLLLNSTAAEVTSTDYIDTYSAGFEISSTAPAAINASGGTFIFLAIA